MRAAILERGQTTLNVVTDLQVRDPRPGEVLVRIAFCGLCHSDLLVVESKPDEVPVVLGHEAAGTVEAVGAGVTAVAPGDKVVLTTLPSEVSPDNVLELYRFRWQVELKFKTLKSVLHLGNPPTRSGEMLNVYLTSKLIVALLIEDFVHNAESFPPWGYPLPAHPLVANDTASA